MSAEKRKRSFPEYQFAAIVFTSFTALVVGGFVIALLTVWRAPNLGLKFGEKTVTTRRTGMIREQAYTTVDFGVIHWGDAVYVRDREASQSKQHSKRNYRNVISVVNSICGRKAYKLDEASEEHWIIVHFERSFMGSYFAPAVYRREGVAGDFPNAGFAE